MLSCLFDITWFFGGIEDFKKITIRNLIIRTISFIFIVLFIKKPDDLILYILINSLSTLFSQMSLWVSIRKYVTYRRVKIRSVFSHFRPALEFFIAKIAVTLYQNTTKTILGLMTTMTIVGYYSNSFSIVLMSGNIINAMNTIMIPRMSNMYGNNDEDGMIKLLEKSIHLQIFFTIPVCFGIVLITPQLVGWFFGNDFDVIRHVLPFMAPVVIFQSFQMSVATQYLIPKKEMKEYNISILIGALITVFSTLILVPFFGIYGAVFGINAGYIVVSILRLRVLVQSTDFVFKYKLVLKFLLSAIFMCVIGRLLTSEMKANIFTTIVQIFIGSIIYMGGTIILKANPLFKKNYER